MSAQNEASMAMNNFGIVLNDVKKLIENLPEGLDYNRIQKTLDETAAFLKEYAKKYSPESTPTEGSTGKE